MEYKTKERNIQLVIELLKAHGIKKVVASPGATNMSMVSCMQQDGSFEIYSSVDERSAAYIACGMAAESGETVVLSCTGATASRNYYPGLTEAYYRKLPIIAITSSQSNSFKGHLYQQLTDRSKYPSDIFIAGEQIQYIKDEVDYWDCENKINRMILECRRHGGGPVHLNVTNNRHDVSFRRLDAPRVIKRVTVNDSFPQLPEGKTGIWITSHHPFSENEQKSIDKFCACYDAVVLCDHTSNYYGKYRVDYALIGSQKSHAYELANFDLLIHIGDMTGDYPTSRSVHGKQIWRVSEDGEIRVKLDVLDYIFEMSPSFFFMNYVQKDFQPRDGQIRIFRQVYKDLYESIPDTLPFSNVWVAKTLSAQLPKNSVVHLGILNSLRSWNLFRLPDGVMSNSNVGGFGIDGCLSSMIGASFVNRNKIFYGIVGDLAFFYDINSLGNRHIGNNIRIVLVNNGLGGEFKLYPNPQNINRDNYICAAGHYGNKSQTLVKHFSEDLGFEYMSASNKEELLSLLPRFTRDNIDGKPMLLEIFEDINNQKQALDIMYHLAEGSMKEKVASKAEEILKSKFSAVKKLLK
jgi:2-succinyl-5-enolpyruvyl-6-hydroxy-3-cyclohexene-1-carboxylate synthase